MSFSHDLIIGGWIDKQFDPQTVAIEHFSYSLANGNPPVVITEGSTDVHFLQAAIRVRFHTCNHSSGSLISEMELKEALRGPPQS